MNKKSGFIAIAGRPNAGKSTLLNQVLGSNISIVTPKAQTTRERVLGILTDSKGQIVFIDTPGIHKAKEGGINEYMMNEVRSALEDPSAIWYIVDPDSKIGPEQVVIELLAKSAPQKPVFLIINKSDLKRDTQELENKIIDAFNVHGVKLKDVFRISAKRGEQVKELLKATWQTLSEGPLYYPDEEQISDRPVRFFVSEKIREQLFLCLGDEVPYSCGVEIERFDEKVKPPRIEAIIYVERDSQKGIVIGKGGQKIKEIGQNARQEVEKFLGHTVFLGLKVKVLKDWTRDPELMKKLGYQRHENAS